jgi:hypothetical protein
MREDKDNSAKWLLEHHGDAALWLGGITGYSSWRPDATELAHPLQRPAGLLEVNFPGQARPDLVVVEVATYPEQRAEVQALHDALLVYLDRRIVPEVVVLVLHPKGSAEVADNRQERSRLGRTRLGGGWTVVNVWNLSAEDLLAAGNVGLIPWVPLARTTQEPEALLRQCRERIDHLASPAERGNLLVVTQVMATLRYNDPGLLTILGGKQMIIESPLIAELLHERERDARQADLLGFLRGRFGNVPEDLAAQVRVIQDLDRLAALVVFAGSCPDLDAFRAALTSAPPPASTTG